MSDDYQFDFHPINDTLLNFGAVHSASELHGYLCGLLSGGKKLDYNAWQRQAETFLDLESVGGLPEGAELLLNAFFDNTEAGLSDENYTFAPLLPGDGSNLTRRIGELAVWCQGFLHGVGASGLKGDKSMSPDSAEVLRDLAEISQVESDVSDEEAEDAALSEEREAQLFELSEYVKTAVLTFRADTLKPSAATDIVNKTQDQSEGPKNDETVH